MHEIVWMRLGRDEVGESCWCVSHTLSVSQAFIHVIEQRGRIGKERQMTASIKLRGHAVRRQSSLISVDSMSAHEAGPSIMKGKDKVWGKTEWDGEFTRVVTCFKVKIQTSQAVNYFRSIHGGIECGWLNIQDRIHFWTAKPKDP